MNRLGECNMSENLSSLEFRVLSREDAGQIADWRYSGEYAIYDIPVQDRASSIEYMLDPANGYFGAYRGSELVGFCSIGPDGRVPGWEYDESAVDVGAGMRPDLTGLGQGGAFLSQAFRFAESRVGQRSLRATIASWNERALTAARQLGFVPVAAFHNPLGRPFTVLVRLAGQ